MPAREVSPVHGVSIQEVLDWQPGLLPHVAHVRTQKREGRRLKPSACLTDRSALLSGEVRAQLLDRVAGLVDENLVGRSEMCNQFAGLLSRALVHMGIDAHGVVGDATYYDPRGQELFRWKHAWVRVGTEVVDGNADALVEGGGGRPALRLKSYWGPMIEMPGDRRLSANDGEALPTDEDLERLWWPELRQWLDQALKA